MNNESASRTDPFLLAQLYRQLGRFLLDGREATIRQFITRLPELVEGLAETDPEALAVDHYQVLGREVPPYASVFCEADGRVGGSVTEAYHRLYLQAGFALDPRAEPADHLGQILYFLAFCLERQTPACRRVAGQLLHGERLAWLPLFAFAVQRQQVPFIERVVQLIAELIRLHGTLVPASEQSGTIGQVDPAMPGPEDDLAALAAYLTTPIRCGFFLSLSDLQQLGRQLDLPVGFGRRRQVLESLLHTAALHGRSCALLEALLALVEEWRQYLQTQPAAAQRWLDRLEATRALLQTACTLMN